MYTYGGKQQEWQGEYQLYLESKTQRLIKYELWYPQQYGRKKKVLEWIAECTEKCNQYEQMRHKWKRK